MAHPARLSAPLPIPTLASGAWAPREGLLACSLLTAIAHGTFSMNVLKLNTLISILLFKLYRLGDFSISLFVASISHFGIATKYFMPWVGPDYLTTPS